MINNTNLSFGTFKIITQGCEPMQQKLADQFFENYKNTSCINIYRNKETNDIFVHIKPKTNRTSAKLDALKAEETLAELITSRTGIKTIVDIMKETPERQAEQKKTLFSIDEHIKDKTKRSETGLKNLEKKGIPSVIEYIENCFKIDTGFDLKLKKISSQKKKWENLTEEEIFEKIKSHEERRTKQANRKTGMLITLANKVEKKETE